MVNTKLKDQFIAICRTEIKRNGIEELLLYLEQTDFYSAPASTRFHGNYAGGLVEHSLNVSYKAYKYAKKHNLGVVRELVGHGVGNHLHEKPDVPNFGTSGTGPILKEGMTIAIEPMLNLGTREIYLLEDDWTIITQDGLPSAHFEHTVVVTKDGLEILTGDDNFE